MSPSTVRIRPLTVADLPAVVALEAEAYEPALHESEESLRRLLELYPDGALGAFDGPLLCGYILGVPLDRGGMLELRRPLDRIPAGADTFYIHDIAVAVRCRGSRVGFGLADQLIRDARTRGFRRFALVSVQGSAPFWERFGFRARDAFEYAPGSPSVKMSMEW